ncbi:Prenylated Rab acceptor protein 1 [Balamuthia mandrillaris]
MEELEDDREVVVLMQAEEEGGQASSFLASASKDRDSTSSSGLKSSISSSTISSRMTNSSFSSSAPSTSSSSSSSSSVLSFPADTNEAKLWVMRQAKERIQRLRSWKEFVNRENFSVTRSQELPLRIWNNLLFFQSNYLLIFLAISLLGVFSNPFFLVTLGMVGTLWFLTFVWKETASRPVVLMRGRPPLSNTQKTAALLLISLFCFYVTSTGWTLVLIVGASLTVILLHAAFFNGEISNLDFPLAKFMRPLTEVDSNLSV